MYTIIYKVGEQHVPSEIIDIHGPLKGEIEVPGDKSMTHRAIMLASLATGQTTIFKPLLGEDCRRTMEIFKLLGVSITEKRHNRYRFPGYQHSSHQCYILVILVQLRVCSLGYSADWVSKAYFQVMFQLVNVQWIGCLSHY